jgi:hypothetical protein
MHLRLRLGNRNRVAADSHKTETHPSKCSSTSTDYSVAILSPTTSSASRHMTITITKTFSRFPINCRTKAIASHCIVCAFDEQKRITFEAMRYQRLMTPHASKFLRTRITLESNAPCSDVWRFLFDARSRALPLIAPRTDAVQAVHFYRSDDRHLIRPIVDVNRCSRFLRQLNEEIHCHRWTQYFPQVKRDQNLFRKRHLS